MASRYNAKQCEICTENLSKYTCSSCYALYCSVPCYRKHKETSCSIKTREPLEKAPAVGPLVTEESTICDKVQDDEGPSLEEPVPLRPLTSLKWPYVPDESAFPDPLKRDDPKTLQLHQYEAIATSPAIRKIFEEHPELKTKIRSIDSLRGHDREEALQRALGVSFKDVTDISPRKELSEDTLALRELAEAIEGAVRKGQQQTIGLDWDLGDV